MPDGIVVVDYQPGWPAQFAEYTDGTTLSGRSASSGNDRAPPALTFTFAARDRFSEQFALLFREYLRTHRERALKYADLKRSLAERFGQPDQRQDYVEAKDPFIWDTIHLADDWAQASGWEPPPSDS